MLVTPWFWFAAALILGFVEMLAPGYIFLGIAIGAGLVGGMLLVTPAELGWTQSVPILCLIFAVLSLMYARAWRLADRIGLDAAERISTKGSLRAHLLSVAIGVVSMLLAVVSPKTVVWSGLVYFLMGPVQGLNGFATARAIERLEGAGEAVDPAPAD